MRNVATAAAAAALLWCAVTVQADEPPAFELATLLGRVVFQNEALAEKFGIATVEEAKERTLALQTAEGTLVPLVEDVRGRAFRADQRLRKAEVELLVRRYTGSPAVQVIRVFEVTKDGKFELDYWCDICAISMFELKPCDCCQGDTVLRRRKAE